MCRHENTRAEPEGGRARQLAGEESGKTAATPLVLAFISPLSLPTDSGLKSFVDMKAPLPFEGISEPGRDRYRTLLLATALAGAFLFYSSGGPQLPPRPLAPQSGLFERYCRTGELSSGMWEPVVVDGHTWPRLKDSTGYRFGLDGNRSATSCYSRNSTLLPQLVAANSWRWKPTGCAIRPFDPARLVRRLAERAKERALGGGILFVGGEDCRMQAISLESLLGRYIKRGAISDFASFSSVKLESGAGAISFSKYDSSPRRQHWARPYTYIVPKTYRSDYLVSPGDWQLPLPDERRAGELSANATEGETNSFANSA